MIHTLYQPQRWLLPILVCLLMFASVAKAQAPAATTPKWTTPEMMGASWFPDIATDSTGTVYLAWAASDANYDLVMFSTKSATGTWRTPNDIQALPAPVGRYATRPALLVDPQGVLHLTYRGDTIWSTQVPLLQANDAQAWSVPQAISAAGYFSRLVYGRDQKLHLFFTENVVRAECTNCFHLMYQQSSDGETWSSPIDLTPALDGMAKPQIIVDALNNFYVVFEAGYGGDLGQLTDPATVMYITSYNGGTSWSAPLPFASERTDNPDAQARNVALAIDRNQTLVATWWAIPDDVIYYQLSHDQARTWSRPAPIPGVAGGWSLYQARLDNFTMATDSAGYVHLVLSGRRSPAETNHSLLHLTWDGSNWSPPDTIATYTGDVPEWPQLAIANGNQLHVAWFVRDQANLFKADTTNYRVWYAQGQANAPTLAPVEVVVPTPTPTLVTAPIDEPDMPLTSTASLLDAHLRQPTHDSIALHTLMTENDDISLFMMSLLPTALLVGFFAILRHLRKRE